MAPITFCLVTLLEKTHEAFVTDVESLDPVRRPLWVGQCHHWVHQPHLSSTSLNGTGPEVQKWDYLLVFQASSLSNLSSSLPDKLEPHVAQKWSIRAEVQDDLLASLSSSNARRSSTPIPVLPAGWSAANHTALDAAIPPPDLEASLALRSHRLGSNSTQTAPITLKDFIRTFGTSDSGPVAMLNLLSYNPGKRETYFQYVAAFSESVGSKYGGEPIFLGLGVDDWSSRGSEGKQDWEWEDTALIWYPSIWHFGKMLDDEAYVEADRKYKTGVLRDNPILCCTEVEIVYRH